MSTESVGSRRELVANSVHTADAESCQILRLKCTKFDFGWGSAVDPAGGAHNASQTPLAGFKGPTSKERVREKEGKGKGKATGGRDSGWEGERGGGEEGKGGEDGT